MSQSFSRAGGDGNGGAEKRGPEIDILREYPGHLTKTYNIHRIFKNIQYIYIHIKISTNDRNTGNAKLVLGTPTTP
jgi:hypothetical protein